MANNDIDDILARLDEIKKLQAELRHLVPRIAGNSSPRVGPQDLTSDTSIRFPSLLTFPGVPSLASSSAKDGRLQKSAARLNLSSKLSLNDGRPSTASANTWKPVKGKSSVRETNALRDSPRSAKDVVARSHARNSVASNASAASSTRTAQSLTKSNTASRIAKQPQGGIKEGLDNGTASADKTSRATVDKSNLAPNDESNSSAIRSSVQTSDVPVCVERSAGSRKTRWCLKRSSHLERNGVPGRTLIERIMRRLNYCFVDDKRVTVPHYYPGSGTPKRVHVRRTLTSEGESLQIHLSAAKIFAN